MSPPPPITRGRYIEKNRLHPTLTQLELTFTGIKNPVSTPTHGRAPYLSIARQHGLEQGVVDEDVLVLGLDHVVPLGPEAGHVTVNVDGLLVLEPLEHGVDDDEGASPANPGTAISSKLQRRFVGARVCVFMLYYYKKNN